VKTQQSSGEAYDHNYLRKLLLPWSHRRLRHILKNLTLRLVASGVSLDATQNLFDELGTSISKTFSD
jgi:hypothetical protein